MPAGTRRNTRPPLGLWHWTSERGVIARRRRDDDRAGHARLRIAAALLRRGEHVCVRAPVTRIASSSAGCVEENRCRSTCRSMRLRRAAGASRSRDRRPSCPPNVEARPIVVVWGCACSKYAWRVSVCVDTAPSNAVFSRHMIRRTLQITSLALVLSISAAACSKKAPEVAPPAAATATRRSGTRRRRHPHRHRHHRRRRPRRSPRSRSSQRRRWSS